MAGRQALKDSLQRGSQSSCVPLVDVSGRASNERERLMRDRLTRRPRQFNRSDQIDDTLAMIEYLEEHPDLPLPIQGAWAMPPTGEDYGQEGDAFHVFVDSKGKLEALADQLDRREASSAYPFHPVGVRRGFGSIAYELLVDEEQPFAVWRTLDIQPERPQRLRGIAAMYRWLGSRHVLPLPTHDLRPFRADPKPDEELLFLGMVDTGTDRDRVASEFDRIDRRPDLPAYRRNVGRVFDGGVRYEIAVWD
jgi:hypothetical protein